MGGGNLNLKKSWHPLRQHNQERIWKEERVAQEDVRKMEQLRKEIRAERAREAMLDVQEQAGLITRSSRMEWMYSGTVKGCTQLTEDREAYLLGHVPPPLKPCVQQVNYANTPRDLMSKIREDPLFEIKKRERDLRRRPK